MSAANQHKRLDLGALGGLFEFHVAQGRDLDTGDPSIVTAQVVEEERIASWVVGMHQFLNRRNGFGLAFDVDR